VRFHAATKLLERSEEAPDISVDPWIRYVFKGQKGCTYWESKSNCYDPKYGATVWRLLVLADLGVTRDDPRIRNAIDLVLKVHQRRDGGFSCTPQSSGTSHACLDHSERGGGNKGEQKSYYQ
jgi:hypothetical protein